MNAAVSTRPVGPGELADLARLFGAARTTRHCWCTAFCTTRAQFTLGWFGGGNARRFAALAGSEPDPMGVLACVGDEVVGWAACGPWSRYIGALRDPILREQQEPDRAGEWFLPCLFVAEPHRGRGVSHALVDAAVQLAGARGAGAVQAWPLAASVGAHPSAFVGREQVFAAAGFRRVAAPTPERVLMRRELGDPAADGPGAVAGPPAS